MRCLVPHLTLMPQQSLRASSDTYTLCCGGRMQHEEANVVQATATPYTDRFCVINVFVMLRQDLREHARDPEFQAKWQEVKRRAKTKAMAKVRDLTGVECKPEALLDVQVRLAP